MESESGRGPERWNRKEAEADEVCPSAGKDEASGRRVGRSMGGARVLNLVRPILRKVK